MSHICAENVPIWWLAFLFPLMAPCEDKMFLF